MQPRYRDLMLFAAPKYRGPVSDHFDGRRFLNIQPTRHAASST